MGAPALWRWDELEGCPCGWRNPAGGNREQALFEINGHDCAPALSSVNPLSLVPDTMADVDMGWELSGSSDRRALDVVDGTGPWQGHGPHYSRRSPGSKTFTGVGQEIVLVRPDAVWAVVRSRVPSPRGSGMSRGRGGELVAGKWVWRCNMFRNLGDDLSSDLIRAAVAMTVREWVKRYGELPSETMQTEIRPTAVKSEIPGYCYRRAGWVKWRMSGKLVVLRCPRPQIERAARGVGQ